jgi:hypothetical protein
MRRFLDVLDERCDGAIGWLASVGFGPADVAALRRRLLAAG